MNGKAGEALGLSQDAKTAKITHCGSQLELKLKSTQQALYLSTNQVSRTLLGPMEGVERDGSGEESMGAVVEASGAKIELLKRRAHNLFKEQSHS
jgi:hypothetical protein